MMNTQTSIASWKLIAIFSLCLSKAFKFSIAGAAPAFAAGVVAGILRIYIRWLVVLACLMALIGAAVTATYLAVLQAFLFGPGVPKEQEVIWTAAIAAFCCSFLLWRNRP